MAVVTQFSVSARRRAAYRIAEGKIKFADIATEVGVDVRTIQRWYKNDETFRELVEEKRKAIDAELQSMAVTSRMGRIENSIELHRRLNQLIEERAKQYGGESSVPGGSTGLVYAKHKKDGIDYEYDSAVVKDILEVQNTIAEEMGHTNPETERSVTIVAIPQFPLPAKPKEPVAEAGDQDKPDAIPSE